MSFGYIASSEQVPQLGAARLIDPLHLRALIFPKQLSGGSFCLNLGRFMNHLPCLSFGMG
jgi:hypothetical protein